MNALYPAEAKKIDVISHLEELRRRILYCIAILLCVTVITFIHGNFLMDLVKRPSAAIIDELIFISPTEAFSSFLKTAFLAAFIVSFPFILYQIWAFLAPAFDRGMKKRVALWLLLSLFLFFTGILFSYLVIIPAALNFLLNFNSGIASARITLGKYVSFIGALILAGGLTFEIPVVIGLSVDCDIIRTDILKRKRHLAFLAILIFAAVITPTQDIVNMLLFAFPMMLLFEAGIIIGSFLENRKKI
ncbi:MAG: twin-arginine translocase subunit TatC [Candidatus Omnitrophota bacterium]